MKYARGNCHSGRLKRGLLVASEGVLPLVCVDSQAL